MKGLIAIATASLMSGIAYAELDTPQVASAVAMPFITGYTLTKSRAAELGSLGRLWDGYRMNVVRGDIGESVAERAFFGGPELSQSKKGNWVSVAPRFGRQGIDHVFLRVDKNGLPNNMIIGESKYGSSKRGYTKKDGLQMGSRWRMVRLSKIGEQYTRFAKSSMPLFRSKNAPIGAKGMDVYFSKTHKAKIWQEGGRWYTDAEGMTDARLRTRAATYGKYFSAAGAGIIRTRNFEFRIQEQRSGDYYVKISKLTDEAQVVSSRTVVVPEEFVARGRVDDKTLMEALKRRHHGWSDKRIAQEAKDIKKVVSNKEFLCAAKARENAIKEINRSSVASAGIAGALSLVFQLGSEVWEHGADFKSYDLERVSVSTVKGVAVAGAASYLGQRTALSLAGNTILGQQISSKAANQIGGCVGGAIILAESFGGCVIGNKSWRDGSVEAGIGAASMVAGHYAAVGVSAWLASGTAATGVATAAGTAGAATAGSATAAAGTAAAAGAGAAGSGGFMAIAAAAGPAIAAVAVGAAISYGGYVVYSHYKSIELATGGFVFNERKMDLFFEDRARYDRSINRTLGCN